MNATIRRVEAHELEALPIDPESLADILRAAGLSDPIFRGDYRGHLLVVLGFIPPTILADEAYLWMYTDRAAYRFPYVVGRWGWRVIAMTGSRRTSASR